MRAMEIDNDEVGDDEQNRKKKKNDKTAKKKNNRKTVKPYLTSCGQQWEHVCHSLNHNKLFNQFCVCTCIQHSEINWNRFLHNRKYKNTNNCWKCSFTGKSNLFRRPSRKHVIARPVYWINTMYEYMYIQIHTSYKRIYIATEDDNGFLLFFFFHSFPLHWPLFVFLSLPANTIAAPVQTQIQKLDK